MEHRWGARVPVDVPVRLDAGREPFASGSMRNVSLSGAYLETSAKLPPWTPVVVELEWGRFSLSEPHRIPACVIRRDARGLGVEWSEFASETVRTLIVQAERSHASEPIVADPTSATLDVSPVWTPYAAVRPD